MKTLILAASASIALASFSGAATAGCSASPVNTVAALADLLRCKTVCVPDTAPASWKWQEFHQAYNCNSGVTGLTKGELVDYKLGRNHPIDPSETVGTWSVTGDSSGQQAVVTHDYGSGGRYTYSVFYNGGTSYSFCVGSNEIATANKIISGQVSCQ